MFVCQYVCHQSSTGYERVLLNFPAANMPPTETMESLPIFNGSSALAGGRDPLATATSYIFASAVPINSSLASVGRRTSHEVWSISGGRPDEVVTVTSRWTICHHTRRRTSASIGGMVAKWSGSRCNPIIWATRSASPTTALTILSSN